ncbi:MAG: NAD(P)/FAD-dependent oxidoreductase [Candidatus Saccharimonadales bacterium]
MSSSKLKILVVGGGFGGLKTALELSGDSRCEVTLLSDHSHFRYYPALYNAATGGKMAGSRIRLKNFLGDANIKFVRAAAKKLDRQNKQIVTEGGQKLSYDKLVLALGSVTNYFGIKGLREHSFGIKSAEEVMRLREQLHGQFIENGCPDLNYVIVGGGPTGIELAGALPDYLKEVMQKHGVKDCKLSIKLVEAAPRLLPRSPKTISSAVLKRLKTLGVDVLLGHAVEGQTSDRLMVGGKPLMSHTVIWTAGVANHPFFAHNSFRLADKGKVEVDDYLQAEQDIFVIGDNADTPYSGMAQTALHDGEFVAKTIKRQASEAMPEAYTPKKPITVIPVGPHWAAVEWGSRAFTGFTGWILRILADFVAFNDLTSVLRAGKQWLVTIGDEEMNCPNCMPRKK